MPPMKWEMGRVHKAIASSDNLVRVVDAQTKNGLKRRGISPLPVIHKEIDPIDTTINKTNESNTNKIITSMITKNNMLNSLTTNIIYVIIYCLLILPILGSKFNLTKFNGHPGIFYDGLGEGYITSHRWHLLTYYNMSNYWQRQIQL